jgi:hypothetical protein
MSRKKEVAPLDRNLPPMGKPWRRWGTGLFNVILFCVLGSVCLLWALGYRVNWQTVSIEQTSTVDLSTAQSGLKPTVFVNGIKQDSSLPLIMRWLFPGHYDIYVQLDGYRPWHKIIDVEANQRVSYGSILLLYTVPKPITSPDVRIDQIVGRSFDNDGIEVRSGNELWIDNQLITRLSDDIHNPEYYFDKKHVVYQAGDQLIMRDLLGGTSETLVTLASKTPVSYVMQENGRVLVYVEGDVIKGVELFQSTSIIDRLGVSR